MEKYAPFSNAEYVSASHRARISQDCDASRCRLSDVGVALDRRGVSGLGRRERSRWTNTLLALKWSCEAVRKTSNTVVYVML